MAKYPLLDVQIPDPYPGAFETVTGFNYETRLVLAREPEALENASLARVSYIVDEDYTVSYEVDGVKTYLTIPRGMLTDLASVPRAARWIVGRVGLHLEASIVHDFLYVAWQLLPGGKARREDYDFANAVLYAGMDAADVPRDEKLAVKTAFYFSWPSWGVYQDRDDGTEDVGLFVNLDGGGDSAVV